MYISSEDWRRFKDRLSAVNKKAKEEMVVWIQKNGFGDSAAMIDFAYGLATKYGEGAAALSAEMYDAIAELERAMVPPAVMADTAPYGEVAKAVVGTAKHQNPETVGDAVARLVKRTGADTTLLNAERDGAQFAWVPQGDTCAFCVALASRGWQYMSKNALKNGHAEHIHANCDCTYAVRFDSKSGVAGYDPEKYRAMYDGAEGDKPQEKINSLRRRYRKEHKGEINARKRAAYAEQKEREQTPKKITPTDVTAEYRVSARPGKGSITVEDGKHRDTHADEIAIAKVLHESLGGDIVVRKEIPGIENADYLWESRLWELKSPEKEKNLNKLVQKGLSQIFDNPGGIVVDRSRLDADIGRVEQIITGRMSTSIKHTTDVIIIRDGKIEKVLRYKKRGTPRP